MGYSSELRAQRIAQVLIILIVVLIAAAILVYTPDTKMGMREIRFYIWLFFLLFILVIVVLLMTRNAIVMNTAYLIKLREQMHNNGKQMDDLTKQLRMLIDTNKNLIKTIKNETGENKIG